MLRLRSKSANRLLAFPIVDEKSRLPGIVDVQLYADELNDLGRREESEELFQLIGVLLEDTEHPSLVNAFLGRFSWLVAVIGGGILAACLSVSIALQVLRGQRPTVQSILEKLRIEFLTGLFRGLAYALVVAGVAPAWLRSADVVVCLLGGIAGGWFQGGGWESARSGTIGRPFQ